jgi:hypothetical protein
MKTKNTMKSTILSALLVLLCTLGFAQQDGNIVLFSEGGERFHAILNGERINADPATNVKVAALNQPGYKLRVIFEDKSIPDLSKDVMVTMGEEIVYMIKKDKKGAYKVAWRSNTTIAQAPPAPASQYVYTWGAPQPVIVAQPAAVVVTQPAPAVVQQTTTTTTTTGTPTGENVSMNVNVPGFGMNVNINTNETNTQSSTTISQTTTTTTTTASPAPVVVAQPVPAPAPCAMMDARNFESARSSIQSKSFEDSKLTLAKQIAKNNCLSAAQVKSIMQLFSFEETRLDFAKYAYGFCYEPNNYYQVNDAFDFETSIEDLDKYIGSFR